MVENPSFVVPRDSIGIGAANSIAFPLHHLTDCLEQVDSGTVFSGLPLEHFRNSNRACRNINIAAAISGSVIGTTLVIGKQGGFKGKLVKTSGLLVLAHAVSQVKRAREKSRRQALLDSRETVGKQDLTTK